MLGKRDAQAPVAQNQREADIARITDEPDSVGKATEAERIAHPGVPAVEIAATTTGNTDAEA